MKQKATTICSSSRHDDKTYIPSINQDGESSQLPLVLCVEDLMQILSIGRNTAYGLVRSGTIKSIRIGKCYRIPRDAVLEYLSEVHKL